MVANWIFIGYVTGVLVGWTIAPKIYDMSIRLYYKWRQRRVNAGKHRLSYK